MEQMSKLFCNINSKLDDAFVRETDLRMTNFLTNLKVAQEAAVVAGHCKRPLPPFGRDRDTCNQYKCDW